MLPAAFAIILAALAIILLPQWRWSKRLNMDVGYGPTIAMLLLLVVVSITWARGLI